jgi:hypothetical protein
MSRTVKKKDVPVPALEKHGYEFGGPYVFQIDA